MGGKKKLNLKQMERQQDKKDEEDAKKEKKKEKTGLPKEKRLLGIVAPDAKNEKLVGELKKMNVLTPYAVASRLNIRISAAKDFLEQLEANGTIQLVSGNHNIKIYKPD
ncbi:MAG TPA: eS25 family ribosomal protein [Candidatus Bathyarchaeia archaeon]|nr:eS25 family ribosomal protein [Candidatus Bathyarchaeia archaeon]